LSIAAGLFLGEQAPLCEGTLLLTHCNWERIKLYEKTENEKVICFNDNRSVSPGRHTDPWSYGQVFSQRYTNHWRRPAENQYLRPER
jgi:hypothetical protein